MSEKQVEVWVNLSFPEILLKGSRTYLDCNHRPVHVITAEATNELMSENACVMTKIVRQIHSNNIYGDSGFRTKHTSVLTAVTFKRIPVAGLGFSKAVKRSEIVKRARRYNLTPIDNPRNWAVPLRVWYKDQPLDEKITMFGVVNHGDVIKKIPLELMFTIENNKEKGKFLSARSAKREVEFQPDDILVMECL